MDDNIELGSEDKNWEQEEIEEVYKDEDYE